MIWILIRKDLVRRWRSPLATLVMIAFPIFMSLTIGGMWGSSGDEDFPKIKVLVQNLDEDGFISNAIVGMLGQEDSQEFLEVVIVGEEGARMMEQGKASAMVVIPDSFTVRVLDRRETTLQVVRNPAEGIKPEIISQGVHVVATYLDQAARLLGAELSEISSMIEADEVPDAAKVGAVAASVMLRIDGAQDALFPPLLEVGGGKESEDEEVDTVAGQGVFGYVMIMTAVMALMFVATRSHGDLFEEKNNGMLRRQLATPLDLGLIVTAKTIFAIVFGLVVLVILAVIGLTVDWIPATADPLGVVLVAVAFSMSASGFMALINGLVGSEKQAGIVGWLVIMGMSALGGSMFPYDNMPAPLQAIAPWTINHWAIDGFTELVFNEGTLVAVTTHLAVLFGVGIVTNVLARFILVRRFRGVSA